MNQEVKVVVTDPIVETVIPETNMKILVGEDPEFEGYKIILYHLDENQTIREFLVEEFDEAMKKLHELTVAFVLR